jgi:crossover junction endodeoxyribonuclease RusA
MQQQDRQQRRGRRNARNSGGLSRFVVTLPYPPSVNMLWRRVGNRTLLSAEGRRYHETVGRHIAISGRQVVPEPPHAVSIVAYLPDRRRRDVDNILKALLDPLYRAIGHDDSVITRLDIEKREPDELGPRVDVTIAPADHRPAGRMGGEG